jgi:hypothetical protein
MIRVVSRVGVWKGMSGGSVIGLMRVVMLVRVRVWGVHVRLFMTMGIMSTSVPGRCERNAFARGVYFFYNEAVGVLKVIVRTIFLFSYLNFTDRGVSTA